MSTQPPVSHLPRIVQTAWCLYRPVSLMRVFKRRYGDVCSMRMLDLGLMTLVQRPEHLREVFQADSSVLTAGEFNGRLLEPLLGTQSTSTSDGDEHLVNRRVLLGALGSERVARLRGQARESAERSIDELRAGTTIRFYDFAKRSALRMIIDAIFGFKDPKRSDRAIELVNAIDAGVLYGPPAFASIVPSTRVFFRRRIARFERSKADLDDFLYAEIDARRAAENDDTGEQPTAILDLLIAARYEDGSPLARTKLRDELVLLLIAGHESSATTLAWAVELLGRHPEVLEKVRAETLRGDSKEYLDAVIKETLRMRPVLPVVVRVVQKPFSVGGFDLPVGSTVAASTWNMQNEEEFHERAHEFLPDRFIGDRPESFTWLPFGNGVRRCVGDRVAMMQIRELMIVLLGRVEFETVARRPAKVRRRAVQYLPHHGTPVAIRNVSRRALEADQRCDTGHDADGAGLETGERAPGYTVQSLREDPARRAGLGSG
ncbi:MAG: cytochrome P450 [Solirubrobacterales bacterium]